MAKEYSLNQDRVDGRKISGYSVVTFGDLEMFFSHQRLIGVRIAGRLFVTENHWGSTSVGRHLNHLQPDKTKRMPYEEFIKLIELRIPIFYIDPGKFAAVDRSPRLEKYSRLEEDDFLDEKKNWPGGTDESFTTFLKEAQDSGSRADHYEVFEEDDNA